MILTSASDSEIEKVWDRLSEGTVTIAIGIAVVFVAWLILKLVINWTTRGMERGAELSARKARKLAKYGKTPPPPDYETDLRLGTERRRKRARTIRAVATSAATVVAALTILFIVLQVLGVPVAALLASAGVLSVAIGFGAQSLVKDLISGLFMLVEDQYGVGDIIDVGEAVGTVEEVGLRCVRLRSLDGTVWYVPNGEIVRVGNMTRTWSRALLEVRFHFDTDVEVARKAMFDAVAAARKNPEVEKAILSEPEIPGIEAMAYNSVSLRLVMKVNPSSQWMVQREVRRELRRILVERDIELSAPESVPSIGVHVPGATVDTKTKKARVRSSAAPADSDGPREVLPPESGDD